MKNLGTIIYELKRLQDEYDKLKIIEKNLKQIKQKNNYYTIQLRDNNDSLLFSCQVNSGLKYLTNFETALTTLFKEIVNNNREKFKEVKTELDKLMQGD